MNKKTIVLCTVVMSAIACQSFASPLDWFKKKLGSATSTKLSDTTIGVGLKEALNVGIKKTILMLGKKDGFFARDQVKILLPESIRKIESTLRRVGLGPRLDEFTLSMNRAAETAAPVAADIFSSAIADMSFDDIQKIYKGSPTAATEYLKEKTSKKILEQFQPIVNKIMAEYAVTKKSEEILAKAQAVPIVGKYAVGIDINKYVSSKALDGLFTVLGQEEAKIRTDPKARVTDLLKEVFN